MTESRIVFGLVVVVLLLLSRSLYVSVRSDAPPVGGYILETVADSRGVRVYRFRDGSRVCYVAAADSVSDTISCVVSP